MGSKGTIQRAMTRTGRTGWFRSVAWGGKVQKKCNGKREKSVYMSKGRTNSFFKQRTFEGGLGGGGGQQPGTKEKRTLAGK